MSNLELLKKRLLEAEGLGKSFSLSDFNQWREKTLRVFERAYGSDSRYVSQAQGWARVGIISIGDDVAMLRLRSAVGSMPRAIDLLKSLIDFEEETEADERKTEKTTMPEDNKILAIDGLHPVIRAASEGSFLAGTYRAAAHDAFIAAIDTLKKKSNYPKKSNGKEKDGEVLVNWAFGGTNPHFVMGELPGNQTDQDFRRGLYNLWVSVVCFRNEKSHTITSLDNPEKALSYIHVASLALKLLDETRELE